MIINPACKILLGKLLSGLKRRTRAEDAREKTEWNHREIFNARGEAIFIYESPMGRLLDVSDSMPAMYGYDSKDEVLNGDIGFPGADISPDMKQEIERRISMATEEGPQVFEWLVKKKNGEVFWSEISLFYTRSGEQDRLLAVVCDIDERKQMELYRTIRLKTLERLCSTGSLNDLLQTLICHIEEVFPGHPASILVLDKSGRRLFHGSSTGLPDFYNQKINGFEISPDAGPCGAAASMKQRTIETDIQGSPFWPGFKKLAARAGLGACWSEPILSTRGDVLGTLAVYSAQPATPDERDLQQLGEAARLAALAIGRTRAEEDLRGSDKALRNLMHLMPLAVCWSDTDGVLEYLNRSFVKQFGYSPADIPTVRDLFSKANPEAGVPDTFLAEWNAAISESRAKGSQVAPMESKFICKDGTTRHLLINAQVTRNRTLIIFTDITEHDFMQNELLKAQKLESLGVLAGGIAHDFNNILTGILGNISLAKMLLPSLHKSHKLLEEAENASQKASELAHQLLTFAKGGNPIKKEVSIRHLLNESIMLSLRGTNIHGTLETPATLHAVEADEGQLSLAFNNIIINAVQAMPNGGTLKVHAGNVTLDRWNKQGLPSGKYVSISFSDEGCGISDEDQEKIFDPYFTTKPQRTGLGLTSARSIVSRHGGHIEVRSYVSKGTTMIIWLPSVGEVLPERKTIEEPPAVGTFSDGSILVMDDEEMIRAFATEILGYLGFKVTTCVNGEEAILLYKTAKESGAPFKVVIMDLTIPGGMGGREAARTILEYDPTARLIVSSGYSNDPVMADYRSFGFSGAVPKPYNVRELARTLSSVIEVSNS